MKSFREKHGLQKTPKQSMTKFERAEIIPRKADELKRIYSKLINLTDKDAQKLAEEVNSAEYWMNNKYQVAIFRKTDIGFIHLSIKRLDKNPIHDWRDLQTIKNELVGPEHEGVELYPAESRRVDAANQYHLWCFNDPKMRFDFGFRNRIVTDADLGDDSKQRPFEKGETDDKEE